MKAWYLALTTSLVANIGGTVEQCPPSGGPRAGPAEGAVKTHGNAETAKAASRISQGILCELCDLRVQNVAFLPKRRSRTLRATVL
jgi:hypothetical protein